MSHVMNKENRLPDKEKDKLSPSSQNPTNPKDLKHHCSLLGIAWIRKSMDIFLQVL